MYQVHEIISFCMKNNIIVYPTNSKKNFKIVVSVKGRIHVFDKLISQKEINDWKIKENNPIYKTWLFYYKKLKGIK